MEILALKERNFRNLFYLTVSTIKKSAVDFMDQVEKKCVFPFPPPPTKQSH